MTETGEDPRAAAARENGKLGGRPTTALTDLRKKAREDGQKLLAAAQTQAVQFLVKVMMDAKVNIRERVHCATELLDRGELPKKSASYHGVGEMSELDTLFGTPKLVVFGKFGADRLDSDRPETDRSTERRVG